MRSIAVINQKGGVGKTTTSVNLAAALARMGHRVCLIDLDPQAHASLHLGIVAADSAKTTYGILVEDTPLADARVAVAEGLDVIPAHLDLAAAEVELAGEVGREIILRDKLAEDPRTSGGEGAYDYLIMDCPPSLGVLTLNALTSVQEVFLPLQPHFLALHGLTKLLRTLQLVARRLNRGLKLTGVVLCMYESGTRLAAEVSGDVGEFFRAEQTPDCIWRDARVFSTYIRRNIRLAEAPSFGQSIFDYSAHSNGAEDYQKLAFEVAGHLATAGGPDGPAVAVSSSRRAESTGVPSDTAGVKAA